MRRNFLLFFLWIGWIFSLPVAGFAQELENNPLTPVKLESPRETMQTFLRAMDEYRKGQETGNRAQLAQIDKAVQCLDIADASLVLQEDVGREAAVLLKEVIDRVIVIDYEKIPVDWPKDAPPWRLRGTEISISRVGNGDNAGRFLFTKQTVKNARRFYEKVKHLPYLPGSGLGARYEEPWLESNVPKWAQAQFFLFPNWKWIGLALAILFGAIVKILGEIVAKSFQKISRRAHWRWYLQIWDNSQRPFGYLFVSLFWFFMIQVLGFDGTTYVVLAVIVKLIFSISCVWIAYRLADVAMEFLREKSNHSSLDNHVMQLIHKLLQVFVLVFGVLVVFQNIGINVMSMLAGLGLGGLAFALAAKDTCANFFGSLMIVLDRAYKIGDYIKIGKVEGIVEEVGFRSTRIRTPENSLVSVPNSLVANESIDNVGRRESRRALFSLGLTCDTPVAKIREFQSAVSQILQANRSLKADSASVTLNDLRADNLEIRVEFFLSVSDAVSERREREQILLGVLQAAEKVGVRFAYPTQSVHVESLPRGT